jgi:hypothetical protein
MNASISFSGQEGEVSWELVRKIPENNYAREKICPHIYYSEISSTTFLLPVMSGSKEPSIQRYYIN